MLYSIKVDPPNDNLALLNLSNLISLGLPDGTSISYFYSDGTIQIEAKYQQNLENTQSNINIQLPNSNISIPYTLASSNYLAVNAYSDSVYSAAKYLTMTVYGIVGLALLVFVVGLYSSKVVVTEMIGTVQTAYFGLFILSPNDPLVIALMPLIYSNGYNNLLGESNTGVPRKVSSVGFGSEMAGNLNLMLALCLIPLVISTVLMAMSRMGK